MALVSVSHNVCGSRRLPLTAHAGSGELPSFPCPGCFKRMFTSSTAEAKSKQMVDRCEWSQKGESCLEMFLTVSLSGLLKNTPQASAGSGGTLAQPEKASALPTWWPKKDWIFTHWSNYNQTDSTSFHSSVLPLPLLQSATGHRWWCRPCFKGAGALQNQPLTLDEPWTIIIHML